MLLFSLRRRESDLPCYEQYHPLHNLAAPTITPPPSNSGTSAPPQQSWANWAYHGISAAGEWIYDNASFLGHIALDLFGLIPGIGNAADLLNASWYTWEGDYTNAALSSASAVIGVGIGVTAVKYGNIILQTLPLNAVKNVADNIGTFVGDTLTGAQKLLADQSGAINVTRLYDGMEWVVAKFTGWGPFGRGVSPTNLKLGSFSITDWSKYPSGVPKPSGPFRLLTGAEYDAARKAANQANAALRRADPAKYAGKQIHEIHPVKFGGSPTDPANKIALAPSEHYKLNTWWDRFKRGIQ